MRELEAKEKKEFVMEIVYIVAVESFNALSPCLLPLANSFNFNLFFSILPNIISNNIPIPFL